MSPIDKRKNCYNCKKYVECRKCSNCKMVRYCSYECQKDSWKTHKKSCMKNNNTFYVWTMIPEKFNVKKSKMSIKYPRIKSFINGIIETIDYYHKNYIYTIVFDQEGIPKNLPINRAATKIWKKITDNNELNLRGNVIIYKQKKIIYNNSDDFTLKYDDMNISINRFIKIAKKQECINQKLFSDSLKFMDLDYI